MFPNTIPGGFKAISNTDLMIMGEGCEGGIQTMPKIRGHFPLPETVYCSAGVT